MKDFLYVLLLLFYTPPNMALGAMEPCTVPVDGYFEQNYFYIFSKIFWNCNISYNYFHSCF